MPFKPGNRLNPGGQTSEQRRARDALNRALCASEMMEAGLIAYGELLKEKNPIIVKDFFDRIAGKPKDAVELSGPDGEPLATGVPREELTAFIDATRKLIKDGK